MSEFDMNSLELDAASVTEHLCESIRKQILITLRHRGAVIGISGGIDSSVVAALCARALGSGRVLGVMMPETESSPESEGLARELASQYGFESIKEDISAGLAGLGCYQRRDEAIKQLFPAFNSEFRAKITIQTSILEKEAMNFFHLHLENDKGETFVKRMPLDVYLQIVAASNLKQRLRMTTLYYHAEKRNWAVVGTGNKDEHEQGFFVKYGDGGADLKPIAHLFKMQVYQIAEYLRIPKSIIDRTPTTDTYSAEVTQEEFFFGLDFYKMDMLWYAMEHHISPVKAAAVLELTPDQVQRAYANIERKIKATEYLRMSPLEIK